MVGAAFCGAECVAGTFRVHVSGQLVGAVLRGERDVGASRVHVPEQSAGRKQVRIKS